MSGVSGPGGANLVNGLRAVGSVPAAIGKGILEAPAALVNVLVLLGR